MMLLVISFAWLLPEQPYDKNETWKITAFELPQIFVERKSQSLSDRPVPLDRDNTLQNSFVPNLKQQLSSLVD